MISSSIFRNGSLLIRLQRPAAVAGRRSLAEYRTIDTSRRIPLDRARIGNRRENLTKETLQSVVKTLEQREKENFVFLQICWTTDDIKQRPDKIENLEEAEELYQKVPGDVPAVLAKAYEVYDTVKDLEYYNGHYWTPIRKNQHLGDYLGGKRVLSVRIPEYFENYEMVDSDDEFPEDEFEENEGSDLRNPGKRRRKSVLPGSQTAIERVIRDMADILQSGGYQRSPIKAFTLEDMHQQTIPTQKWVLQEAKKDTTLRSIVLSNPGALQHIVHCLHLDALWRPKPNAKMLQRPTIAF